MFTFTVIHMEYMDGRSGLLLENICCLTELQKVPSYSRRDTSPDQCPTLACKREQVPHICCHKPSALLPLATHILDFAPLLFWTHINICSVLQPRLHSWSARRVQNSILFPSHPPHVGLCDTSLDHGSEKWEPLSLFIFFQATQDFIPLYHILLQFICPAGRRLPISVILPCMWAVSHLWSCPVTLLHTSSIPWANRAH